MNTKELKQLTGAKTKDQAINILYKELQNRSNWTRNGKPYLVAGYDRNKDLVHFTCTTRVGGGGVWHSRVAISLCTAVKNQTGDLADAQVLH